LQNPTKTMFENTIEVEKEERKSSMDIKRDIDSILKG
jgi:hypothetical protein